VAKRHGDRKAGTKKKHVEQRVRKVVRQVSTGERGKRGEVFSIEKGNMYRGPDHEASSAIKSTGEDEHRTWEKYQDEWRYRSSCRTVKHLKKKGSRVDPAWRSKGISHKKTKNPRTADPIVGRSTSKMRAHDRKLVERPELRGKRKASRKGGELLIIIVPDGTLPGKPVLQRGGERKNIKRSGLPRSERRARLNCSCSIRRKLIFTVGERKPM